MIDVYDKRDMILREFEGFVQTYSASYTDYGEEVLKATHALLKELLKAQEPVEPTIGRCEEWDGHDSWWYQCGKCQKPIDCDDKYCRTCGQAVKWE